jgi:hypothetical protein
VVQVIPAGAMTGLATYYSSGVYDLDNYTGTDDAKMSSALAAVAAAGGGTIQMSPRTHTFANQWATTYSGGTTFPLTIRGAGAIALDGSQSAGATKASMSYSGAGAARMDFQHNGSIEIAGILFQDSGGSSVPFFQTTNAVPNIHDCGFIGSGTGTGCFQDAIVLGGGSGAIGAGDTAEYVGFPGAVYRNSFQGIRRIVLLNPAANAVQVYGNMAAASCGSNLTFGACIELLGTSALPVTGCYIYGNCIEENNYPVFIRCTYGKFNVFGPNGLFDSTSVTLYHHYFDVNSLDNLVILSQAPANVPAMLDLASGNSVISPISLNIQKQLQLYPVATPIVQTNGLGAWAQDSYGNYGSVIVSQDTAAHPLLQMIVAPATTVADAAAITGSNVVTSLTAAWATGDLGMSIRGGGSSNNAFAGSFIQNVWNSSTAWPWQASLAYTAGQVTRPASANGHLYQCTTAGTTGSSQPAFPTGGGTVTDGSVVWQDLGAASAAQLSTAAVSGGSGSIYWGRKGTNQSMTGFTKNHIISTGTAPTGVVQAGAGIGATVSYAGNDLAHAVTLTTAGTPAAGALLITTFNLVYDGVPKIALTPKNANAATLVTGGCYATTAVGTWTLTAVGTPPTGACIFDVLVIQ